MTVLFITSKSLGGSGKYIACLAGGIEGQVNCELMYFSSGAAQDQEIERAFKAVHYFPRRPSFNPVALLRDVMFVRRVLRQGRYSAVHTHTSFGGLIGRIGAFLSGSRVKIIHTLHAYGADEFTPYPQKWLYWIIEKGLDAMTDRYISPSRYTREYGRRIRLINPGKATVIYNALPLLAPPPSNSMERQEVRARRRRAGRHRLPVLRSLRKTERRRYPAACNRAGPGRLASFRVVLCGTGELEETLRRLAIGWGYRIVSSGWAGSRTCAPSTARPTSM